MRNFLVHEYFGLDLNEIWRSVEKEIPELKPKIEAFLERLDKEHHH